MAADPNLVLTTVDDALKLAREMIKAGSDLGHWLVDVMTDKDKITVYTARIRDLPCNTQLRFWLANADDEATLRFEGITKRIKLGDDAIEYKCNVGARGKNAIALHTINSGGFDWRVDLHVDAAGKRVIDHTDGGNDNGWLGRERTYIWLFNS